MVLFFVRQCQRKKAKVQSYKDVKHSASIFFAALYYGKLFDYYENAVKNMYIFLTGEFYMMLLHWTMIFLVLAIIAAVLGFGGVARESAGIAKILFIVFLVIWLVSFFSYNM